MEERLDELGHGGFVSELTGVAFNGAETGIIDNAMGQGGLADAWRAVQENGRRASGRWAPNPIQKSCVVFAMKNGAP